MTGPIGFQTTFDALDPHAQARFWAAALGYDVEIGSDFIRSILEQGLATEDDVVEIDGELFWRIGSAIRHPDDAEVARLSDLGARELYRVDEPGAFHTTMADPEGNEFCVQ